MDSSRYDSYYQNALLGLMNGCLMPWDKEVLSAAPLPSTVIEPYMAKEVPDVRESMRLTYETMVVWIDEARKVNYFSKRFVQLSKMIMNGVTTMGRGLITLHARGEELTEVPMSIEDLIGVASYHFRKSHLGVLQTVRSHPEISERLLMNQISWNNMLMRLFKTKEKLSQKSEIRNRKSEISGQCSVDSGKPGDLGLGAREDQDRSVVSGQCPVAGDIEDGGSRNSGCLPSGEKDLILSDGMDAAFDPFKVFGPEDRGLAEPAAIREPGAFSAPRAFSSFQNQKPEGNQNEIRNQKSEIGNQENEEGRMKNEVSGRETEGKKNLKEKQTGRDNESGSDLPKETPNEQLPEDESGDIDPPNTEMTHMRTGTLVSTSQQQGVSPHVLRSENDGDCPVKGQSPDGGMISDDTPPGDGGDSPMKGQSPGGGIEESPGEKDDLESDLPLYLQILKNVYARSGESDEGKLTFTCEENCYLANDPDFNRIYPDQAIQMRSILQNLNSS